MNLNNFESYISPEIVQKGKQYFKTGAIIENELGKYGSFVATVKGSDVYTVEGDLDDTNNIINISCDCPYDWGKICKHMVAVLFDIRQILQNERIDFNENKEQQQDNEALKNLLKTLPEANLRLFLIEAIALFPPLKTKFLQDFSPKNTRLSRIKLDKAIDDLLHTIKQNNYIYGLQYKHQKTQNELLQFVEQAHQCICQQDFDYALDFAETLVQKLTNCTKNHPNTTNLLAPIIGKSIGLFEKIRQLMPKSPYENRIFDFCIGSKLLFSNPEIFETIAHFLYPSIDTDSREKRFHNWILELQNNANFQTKDFFEQKQWLYKYKIKQHRVGKQAAFNFAHQYKYQNNHLLMYAIENNMECQNYSQALYDALWGAQRFERFDKQFKEKQNQILAILKKDKHAILQALIPFFKEFVHLKNYDLLKKYAPKNEWQNTLQTILTELEEQDKVDMELRKYIYMEEKMYHKLFDIVEQSYNPHAQLLELDKYLVQYDIDHTAILYSLVIEDKMNQPQLDREIYGEVARMLKRMKKLHLNQAVANILLNFKQNHQRRRALWQELEKCGIEF